MLCKKGEDKRTDNTSSDELELSSPSSFGKHSQSVPHDEVEPEGPYREPRYDSKPCDPDQARSEDENE